MQVKRRFIAACAISYAVGFVVWRLLIASPLYARWWPLQLSEVLAICALAPLPVLMVAGLLRPSRRLWIALSIPALWFVHGYGALFVPDLTARVQASNEQATLRVMTFNTWKEAYDHQAFSTFVEEWQPDLIALQEVKGTFLEDAAALKATWPYQIEDYVRGSSRVAILSKYPILSYEADHQRFGCQCLQLLVEWRGMVVRVIAVHIHAPDLGFDNRRGNPLRVGNFDTARQERAYAKLLPLIEASREPLVVVGDFNTTERQEGYRLLYASGLSNAHEEAGWGLGLTYPAPFTRVEWFPFTILRIDHVFYDAAWRALDTWSNSLMGSDHKALVADLRWVGKH